MFNGIIQNLGTVRQVIPSNSGKSLVVESDFSSIEIGDSISINGVCTTVTQKNSPTFSCFASKETLAITNLDPLIKGDRVNLEQALRYQGKINGHLVYGHIDTTAKLIKLEVGESSLMEFEMLQNQEWLIPKGSIAINGISLTVYRLTPSSVEVMIIPHTYQATNLHLLQLGDFVNIEFDALGKYLKNYFDLFQKNKDLD